MSVDPADVSPLEARQQAAELVYRAALLLDAADFPGFLALCGPEFRYVAGAYSPEIRRDMIWLDLDRAGLENLFQTLPRHHSERTTLARHLTVYTVQVAPGGAEAAVVSAMQVFRTALDGGATELAAVGKLHDRLRWSADGWRLWERRVRLETRLLGIGSHVPF
jgi:methanesulfonate monooxygenase subunit beta